jgi:hypothetical protein
MWGSQHNFLEKMPWLHFPTWKGDGIDPGLASYLQLQNVHSCTNCAIVLDINDKSEAMRLCSEGLRFPGGEVHVAEVFVTSEMATRWLTYTDSLRANINDRIYREEIMQKHIQTQSRQIAESHAAILRLQQEISILQENTH